MSVPESGPTPRVAHLINGLRIGGAEKLLVTLAGEMGRRELPLTIITLRPNDPAMQRAIEATAGRVVVFPGRRLVAPGRFGRLVRFLRRERFTVLHTHLTQANVLGGCAGRLAGVPVVTTLHNTRMQSQTHLWHGRAENLVLRYLASRVLAVGWAIAAAHQGRLGRRPIEVVPNAVSLPAPLPAADRAALRATLLDGPDRLLLLAVGRLEPQKGLPDLLAAFADLTQTHPGARLLIAGDGSLADPLRRQIAALGLDGRTSLLGRRDDVPALLAAADLYVSASHWEGLPVATLEAMATGLPLAVTAVGDVPRVVGAEMGALVPPRQPEALAAALRALADDPVRRQRAGQAARAAAARDYAAPAWVDRLLAIYAALHTPRRGLSVAA